MSEQPQSFGLLCAIEIVKAKQEAVTQGRTLMRSDVAAIIDRMDAARPKAKRRVRETPYSKMTDEEFIAAMEAEPHMQGVDVRREIGKCQFHFKGLGIQASRMRIIKWLNKADRVLGYNGAGATSRKQATQSGPQEPNGWREWVRQNASDPTWADREWSALSPEAQKYITEQLNK